MFTLFLNSVPYIHFNGLILFIPISSKDVVYATNLRKKVSVYLFIGLEPLTGKCIFVWLCVIVSYGTHNSELLIIISDG